MRQENNQLLVICGPTSTGKTDLGIYLAEKYNGEIISADSRQVYKGMTIGTGKEYSDRVTIWGYDVVNPNEEYSVSHFQDFAYQKIEDITSRHKLPILVGGTGLYIQSVIAHMDTTSVPPNDAIRKQFVNASSKELFDELIKIDSAKAHSLNESDKHNPRRLIRAIEIALYEPKEQKHRPQFNTYIVGLKSDISFLEQRLKASIQKRMEKGMIEEVKNLLKLSTSFSEKAFSATGYREINDYLSGKISEQEALDSWFISERQYVKRQLTWFQKLSNVHWFDIADPLMKEKVEESVKKWHNIVCREK